MRTPARGAGGARPALFLDRDGVVVEDPGYLGDPGEVRLIEGAAAAIAEVNRRGAWVILVTNQSGVARGRYGWPAFEAVQAEIERRLAAEGAHLDGVLACAYHPDGVGPLRHQSHPWRKPEPGMLLAAAEQLDLALDRSWIAGDRARDIQAGRAAGLQGGLLVGGGDSAERQEAMASSSATFAVLEAGSLAAGLELPPLCEWRGC